MNILIDITFFNWMVPTTVFDDVIVQTVPDFDRSPRLKKLFIRR